MSKRNSTFRKCSWLTAETEHFPAARRPSFASLGVGGGGFCRMEEPEGKTILLAPETNTTDTTPWHSAALVH